MKSWIYQNTRFDSDFCSWDCCTFGALCLRLMEETVQETSSCKPIS